jgi:putative DNA primase/helicase
MSAQLLSVEGEHLEIREPVDPRPPEFSDDSLALRFAELHKDRLRYVAAWGRWLEWDGIKWKFEDTLHALDLARAVCRGVAATCNKPAIARAIVSAKTVAAIERLAKADRRLAATVEQWDADLWALNTPGGIFDLRTGQQRAHRQTDNCTKATAVAPRGGCPLWLAFLDRITGNDASLRLFLQRMCGYFLTGTTREQALFFGFGAGANGKSVLVSTIAGVLGDYAAAAPIETFIASGSDRHPTELAGLRGARLVTAGETEEGRRWNETRIKTLTGGDNIAARFMRQDFFEYVPQFKLLIVGNHKPGLRDVDEAIRRRMSLIPFSVTIPAEERDPDLLEKLKGEWPGILQWMLEGCTAWQGEGLTQPEIVRQVTADYMAGEDVIAQWIAECCTVKATHSATLAELFASWLKWAKARSEFVGSQKRLSQVLQDRRFTHRRQSRTGRAMFEGVSVNLEHVVNGEGEAW